MESSHPPFVRTRLSALMFLEFFVWGSWGVAITGYAAKSGFTVSQIGWLGAVPAIGAIVSPLFVGLIADRFFAAQRMLCVLHLLGGACLIGAGFCGVYLVEVGNPNSFLPLMILMLLNGLAFMPTIALANAVAFRHIPDRDKFPRIAVLGTIGWIVAILIASVFLGGATEPRFLFQAGVGGIVLALYALTLPDTPPKGAGAGGDVFGLGALKLLRESAFLIFIVCVFLVSIPACGYFFTLMVPMLQQHGYPSPLALTSLCQFAEIVFMFSMPWFVFKLGLKRVILIGMLAWAVRYLCFACADPSSVGFALALVGLILHGLCYSFLYVGSYMYIDRRAPAELKASAQSLLAFLLLGVGYLLGAKGAGFMMGQFPADITGTPPHTVVEVSDVADVADGMPHRILVEQTKAGAPPETILSLDDGAVQVTKTKPPLPRWDDPHAATSAWRYLDLSTTVKGLLGMAVQEAGPDLAQQLDADKNGAITLAEIEALPGDGVTVDGLKYSKDDLVATFQNAHKRLDLKGEVELARQQWLQVQANKWGPIWFWPAAYAFAILLFFLVAFRDKPQEED